jgi:hypothetical protein
MNKERKKRKKEGKKERNLVTCVESERRIWNHPGR